MSNKKGDLVDFNLQQRGQRLAELRRRAGLSQMQFASKINVTQGYLSHIERGDRDGPIDFWETAAHTLNVSVGWLIGWDNTANPLPNSRESVMADKRTAEGLCELAKDVRLCDSLDIEPIEWRALSSLETGTRLSKQAYLSLLMALRSVR